MIKTAIRQCGVKVCIFVMSCRLSFCQSQLSSSMTSKQAESVGGSLGLLEVARPVLEVAD